MLRVRIRSGVWPTLMVGLLAAGLAGCGRDAAQPPGAFSAITEVPNPGAPSSAAGVAVPPSATRSVAAPASGAPACPAPEGAPRHDEEGRAPAAGEQRWGAEPEDGPQGWARGALGLDGTTFVRGHGLFVASGGRHGGGGGSGFILTSRDGRTWNEVLILDVPTDQVGSASIHQVVVTADGFVAWGGYEAYPRQGGGAGQTVTRLWSAGPDGRRWTEIPPGSEPPPGAIVSGVKGGFVGLEGSPTKEPRSQLVHSPDAVHWRRDDVPELAGLDLGLPFATRAGGLVVFGSAAGSTDPAGGCG